mmetsp:Transcript_68922/g.183618  ORF Transcript_68922/g.183618 Transcript_68922/m.183618 type:complete len:748 (+) Transcript_68922:211-2454(+)
MTCLAWGDPHFETFDGQKMNYYGPGEYYLVQSPVVMVQGKYEINPKWPKAAVMTSFAVGGAVMRGHRLVVENNKGVAKVLYDGEPILQEFPSSFNNDLISARFDKTVSDHKRAKNKQGFLFLLPNDITLAVLQYQGQYIDLTITMPRFPGKIDGHCGNFNGNKEDDTREAMFGRGTSGEVKEGDSMFTTHVKGQKSPELDISDCDPKAIEFAEEHCDGLDSEVHYEACVFDVCLTGDLEYEDSEEDLEELAEGWWVHRLVDKPMQLKRGSYLGKVQGFEEFELSLDITPKSKQDGWRSIFHMTDGPLYKNCCEEGNRVPGLWFHKKSTRLHVRMSRTGKGNDGCDPKEELPVGETTTVRVKVQGPYMVVFFADRVVCVSGNFAKKYSPGKRMAALGGDSWHEAADATIANVLYYKARPFPIGELIGRVPVALQRGQFLGTIQTFEQFELIFDIKPSGTQKNWASILHFTKELHRNHGEEGDRIPGIWFRKDSTKLHIRVSRKGKANDGCDPKEEVPMNKVTRVTVKLAGPLLTVKFGNRQVCANNRYSDKVPSMQNVFAYSADPWYLPALAELSNVEYQESKGYPHGELIEEPTKLQRNVYVGTIDPVANFELSFVLNPSGTRKGWSNILHFTEDMTRNCCKPGDRVPGIWFFKKTTRLHIRSSRDAKGNDGCDPKEQLPMNKDTQVTVRQAEGKLVVKFGDKVVCETKAGRYKDAYKPKDRVAVYVADPWHEAADATISKMTWKEL